MPASVLLAATYRAAKLAIAKTAVAANMLRRLNTADCGNDGRASQLATR